MTDYAYGYCTSCQPEAVDNIMVNTYDINLDGISALQVNQAVSKIAGSDSIYQLPYTPINAASVLGFLNSGQQRNAGVADVDDFYVAGDLMYWNADLVDTDIVWVNYLSTTAGAAAASAVPVGSVQSWPAAVAVPGGWIACDTNVLIASYPALYAVILTTYNDGTEAASSFKTPPETSLDASMISIIKA